MIKGRLDGLEMLASHRAINTGGKGDEYQSRV